MVMADDVKQGRDRLVQLLSGTGLEIGALHRPITAPHLKVRYVDRLSKKEALKHYPELAPQESQIVEPDIIDDAETLRTVTDKSQDFLIANHVIEHMRDPIGALLNWARVLRNHGRLFLAVPNKENTFDKERPITTVEHLLSDHEKQDNLEDFKHFEEFAEFVTCRTFNRRPLSEAPLLAKELWDQQYSIHYHVWNYEAFVGLLDLVTARFKEAFRMKCVAEFDPKADEFVFVLEKQDHATLSESAIKYDRDLSCGDKSSVGTLSTWVTPGSSVLEIGPATGIMTRILQQNLRCTVTAIEIDPAAAERAAPFCERMHIGNVETFDLNNALADSHFDFIIFADVLEHLINPLQVLERVRRFLAPKGAILASIPNVGHAGLILDLLAGHFRYRSDGLLDETHLRFFTRESIIEMFKRAALTITKWDRTALRPEFTEFKRSFEAVPGPVQQILHARPDWDTYQFLLRAVPNESAEATDAPVNEIPRITFPGHVAQVFFAVGESFSEDHSVTHSLDELKGSVCLDFEIEPSPGEHITHVRIDPIDAARTFFLQKLVISSCDKPLFELKEGCSTVTSEQIRNGSLIPVAGRLLYIPTGIDPQIICNLGQQYCEKLKVHLELDFASPAALSGFFEHEASDRRALIEKWSAHERIVQALRAEMQGLQRQMSRLHETIAALTHERAELRRTLDGIMSSRSWRLTAPLRGGAFHARQAYQAWFSHIRSALKQN